MTNFIISLKRKSIKNNLRTISFSLFKNKGADVCVNKLIKSKNKNILSVKYLNKIFNFNIKNELIPYQQNILATIAVLSLKLDLNKISKSIFNSYKIPEEEEILLNSEQKIKILLFLMKHIIPTQFL